MIIRKTNVTPRQAAKEFIEQTFEDKRSIEFELLGIRYNEKMRFKLKHGTRWYSVFLLGDFSGFEVIPENQQREAT